jgi:glycosyltransferase involved in cell wall biosynthesis
MISIILPVYQREDIIEQVLQGIWDNSSALVKELIIIIDGCTDKSEEIVCKFIADRPFRFKYNVLYAPNVNEVLACNMGLKIASEPFCMSVQDDQVITQFGYDVQLLKPMMMWSNVFAVTCSRAYDIYPRNTGGVYFGSMACIDYTPRTVFAIRDIADRGPLLLRHTMLESLDYLDTEFAPISYDDVDICMRAYAKEGWLSGVYPMPLFGKYELGTTRRLGPSTNIIQTAWHKNVPIIVKRHHFAIVGAKHDEDRELL